MLKLFSTCHLFSFIALAFSAISAAESLKIDWLLPNSPPFYISGDSDEQGICEALVNKLQTALPQMKHNLLIMPQTRINKMMSDGEKVCFPCMIYRQKSNALATFSQPVIIYPAFSIVASLKKAREIRKKYGSPVDLPRLLADEDLLLGREGARKYGKTLQVLLEKSHAYQNSVLSFASTESTTTLIRMLQKNRADYIIEYPVNINYQKSLGNTDLETIEIQQLKGEFIYGAVGCSTSAKDDFAIKAVSAINKALKDSVLEDAEYISYIKHWMSDAIANYEEQYFNLVVKYNK